LRLEEQESPPIKERSALIPKALNACDAIRDKALKTAEHSQRLTKLFGRIIQENKKIAYPLIGSLALTAGIIMGGNPDNYLGTTSTDMSTAMNDDNEEIEDAQTIAEREAAIKIREEALANENRSLNGFKRVFNGTFRNLKIQGENAQLVGTAADENVQITGLGTVGAKYEYFIDKDKKGNNPPDYLFEHNFDRNTEEGLSHVRLKVDANNNLVENGRPVYLTEDQVLQRRDAMFHGNENDKEWKLTPEGSYVLDRINYSGELEVTTILAVKNNGVIETIRTTKKMTSPVPREDGE